MCNIAGYIGEKDAAPILIEMIKKQQIFDGGLSTGIATVHEGNLYMRKIVGDADALVRETDALSLPGKIGIIHTRPTGDYRECAHPFLTGDGRTAVVQNGTLRDVVETAGKRREIIERLCEDGYNLSTKLSVNNPFYTTLKSGEIVAIGDASSALISFYLDQGCDYPEAIAKLSADFYSDIVTAVLSADSPDSIYVTRISRPMNVLIGENETYIATAKFAFPDRTDNLYGESLPAMQSCRIFKGGYTVTEHRVEGEKMCQITPDIYARCYERVTELLSGRENDPLIYDTIEDAAYRKWTDLWPRRHLLSPYASLVYDVLFALKQEGKLKWVVKPVGKRQLAFMYI